MIELPPEMAAKQTLLLLHAEEHEYYAHEKKRQGKPAAEMLKGSENIGERSLGCPITLTRQTFVGRHTCSHLCKS
jgi:hypothetical protein